ncbi:MAG: zinc-binding dehydrogenase [Eubacteriales bacterium]|nr:zinc-binding dehydrogenase [Eubacteriales bacterium]
MQNPIIPKTCKAVVLTGPNEFSVKNVVVPVPGYEEVLCKIKAVAICGSDPGIIRGDSFGVFPKAYPFIAGHEWAGEVVAVGPDVHEFKIGDRVAGEAHKGCGYCSNCKMGRYNQCLNYGQGDYAHQHYGHNTNGAYTQYQKYSIRSLTHLPDHLSFEEGSMCDTASVALHGIELCGMEAGCSIAVVGPGPVGLCVMRLAKLLGAAKVIVVGRGERLQAAKRFGADEIVDINEVSDVPAAVRELTDGIGVYSAIECSGASGTLEQCVRMARKGGHVALVGLPKKETMEAIPLKYTAMNEISIHGSRANPNTSGKVISLMSSGMFDVKEFITHRFGIDDFSSALDTFVARKDNAMKVVILPND